MKLYMAVAIPAFLLIIHPDALFSKDKAAVEAVAPKPQSRISFGSGIDLIVKGLGLNIDNIRFIKEPKATDYFAKANNKASYASSLIIAANNGIESGRSLNPESPATREQFALALFEAIKSTGPYPETMNWVIIKDEKSFTGGGLQAVQSLSKYKVVTLENGSFRPKAYITKAEATKMVKAAADFVKSHRGAAENDNAGKEVITYTTKPVNDKVKSVELSAGEKPTGGYDLLVNSIVFSGTDAIIHYKLMPPPPGSMNVQMITTPKATTYIPSTYNVVLQQD
ncbi:protease complex subunit PrcB family protein [Chitinophaga polysaccharea]|uniref:protease complex subunit PrcB family protein n=1 Tax=Chitinophaga TaxID=79328 RepID=UPI0014552C0A|nr:MULTISPECIES: protease complex subunit PrcB family protein [Chitinophaga]NLR58670.1 protease complex subunit PrcB family protein [Chitinophaga polysaccharea]NLU91198.1 protease complex subunit PrcB family protein [Chitinophaga sp. Ak27]